MRLLKQLWIVVGAVIGAFVISWFVYMPDAEQRGIWRATYGGSIITLNPFTAKMYSESSVSCIDQLTFPAHMKLVEWAEGAVVDADGDNMLLTIDGTLDAIPYTRIDALPENCRAANASASSADVFDALWAAMDEHYAFFELHGVDWDERRALAPTTNLSDEALFVLLQETLAGLDDGHVQLGSPLGYFSPSRAPDWLPENTNLSRESLWQAARDTVGADLTPIELTAIEYTLLPDGIGYVMIRTMGFDTPFGTLSEPGMAQAFSQAATELQDAKAIIIDLRYNPGGSDTISFGVASHFTAEPTDVLTKTTRDGSHQSLPFTATLLPYDETPLSQPVLVLTSTFTGSAAEILTMSLRDLPNVTVMGENTGGGLSDILGFKLPNGWNLGLSNQTYRTMDGALYEAIGIPPDIPFEIEAAPLERGEDPLLRAAFDYVRNF